MEYKINKFITLKLENTKTTIYIDEKPFILCKGLAVDIPIEKIESMNNIQSIDELEEKSNSTFIYNLPPATRF